MKKPKIEDYGINQNEYEKYLQFKEDKELIENSSIFLSCCLYFLTMTIIVILICNIVRWNIFRLKNIPFEFNFFPLKGGEYIAYAIVSYPLSKWKKQRQLKDTYKLIENISSKNINRMEQFYKDMEQYENIISEEEAKKEMKLATINNAKNMITKINSLNFNKISTEDLKKCMWDLDENNLKEEAESLFDFSLISSNVNIVCFGIDDNISKIEIKQFLDYVKEYNEKIFIYSINEIDNKSLTNNSRIKIINSEKLKKSFLDKYNKELK